MTEPNLRMEEMTWPEVGQALEAGFTTVVVALGATEQHGPHLPLLVDAARGDRLGLEVARRLGNALVAPTIRVGCSEHHMAFPGTLSLRRQTLEALCMDYTVSLARHGFRRVCFVPSHGGNFAPLAEMLDDLRSAVAPDCVVDAYSDLMGFMAFWKNAVSIEAPGWRTGSGAMPISQNPLKCCVSDLTWCTRAGRNAATSRTSTRNSPRGSSATASEP